MLVCVCVVCVWVQNGKLVETIEGPNTPALERAIYLHTPANPDMDDLEVRGCRVPSARLLTTDCLRLPLRVCCFLHVVGYISCARFCLGLWRGRFAASWRRVTNSARGAVDAIRNAALYPARLSMERVL